jgi:hypothetical protein
MMYSLSYQTYKYEHGLTAAEQRAADLRAGETAAALRALWLRLGQASRLGHHAQPAHEAANAPVRVLSSVR